MKKILCDKCGKDMTFDSILYTKLPVMENITVNHEFNGVSIDLCSNCLRKFKSWLKNDEDEEE